MKNIAWSGSVEPTNSLGEVGVNLIKQFVKNNWNLYFDRQVFFCEQNTPEELHKIYENSLKEQPDRILDWSVSPERSFPDYKYEYKYFPFEEDKLPNGMVSAINRNATACIAPSKWCQESYINSGVKCPVHFVPHGVDTQLYSFYNRGSRSYTKENPFTFLNISLGSPRKNIWGLVKSFYMAFPDEENVRLIIKVKDAMTRRNYTRGQFDESEDSRIVCIAKPYSLEELVGLYHKADCYVFPTLVEGFSLTTLSAMSTGLPTILPKHTACAEQCNEYNYPITDYITSQGDYGFIPDAEETASLMREVYDNYKKAFIRGKKASQWVKNNYTWEHAFTKLEEILQGE